MATTMTDQERVQMIAERNAALVVEGDIDKIREIYTPDAIIWHNFDDKEKTVEESLVILAEQLTWSTKLWFEDQRVMPTPSGYVDQHYACLALRSGEQVRVPIIFVVTLEGERIKRLDDYYTETGPLDSLIGLR